MRTCSACRVETDVVPVGFNLLRTTYFLGPLCHAAWSIEAMALGPFLSNQARVHMTFRRWLETRKAAA